MPARLKLVLSYDGGAFAGWQSQLHRETVQDQLESAFYKITAARVRVHGAGRTDAGVHALAQCAHVDLPERTLIAKQWPNALNATLPPTIRVLRAGYVSQSFHARFSAKGKLYRYRIWAAPVLPPLELGRAWHVPGPFDLQMLNAAGQKFPGRHDFAAFAANRGKKEENTVRTIHSLKIRKSGPCIAIEVAGDGFLYKMVRLMVGAMVRSAVGKSDPGEITARLKSARPDGFRFAAPAEGLYLVKVWY
ncbi:MAG TPA: tRNA pseudouridine(38-40) synthase TruA [Chthoniobacterales bacterium]|nr:tRNA pseudouridine(38-40) synthase TruA [Chthoniobacterales bacterium]